MSGPIRRLLGPTKARLQVYVKMGKSILERPVDNSDLDKEEMELNDLIHRFSTNITLLERCNQEWTMLLNVMESDSEEKAAEEKEYLWVTDGSKDLIELLLDSKEIASRLEGCLARVLRKVERSNAYLTQRPVTLAVTLAQPSGSPTDTCEDKTM